MTSLRLTGAAEVPDSPKALAKGHDGGTFLNFHKDLLKALKRSGREPNKSDYLRRLLEDDVILKHPDIWGKVFDQYPEEPTA